MSDVFGQIYASAYDALYHEKDYAAESDLIERIFQSYSDGSVCSILDLGCGTGNHAISLAERGYEVFAVDRSEDMLSQARHKLASLPRISKVVLHQGDIRSINLQRRFDAALMMFAVLGYQLETVDVVSALRTARLHLRPGGLFIFDIWYGPAVLSQRPSQRVKVIPTQQGQILRVVSGELDIRSHTCTVHYHLWQLQGNLLVAEVKESHKMRYFFPMELNHFLEDAGLAPIRLGAFPDFHRDPDETTWNALGVALAV